MLTKNPTAYKQLATAVAIHHDPTNGFHIATFEGRFEDAVGDILQFIRHAFALVFIDPTGWTGYPYHTIAPVLRHRPSEVLINFMYDHINRFAASDDPATIASLAPILGGPNWGERLDPNLPRGLAVEKLFRYALKTEGQFEYVLSTRIDKAIADRAHFFIAYGTRSDHGLKAFREVEYRALKGHEQRRVEAKLRRKADRTGMSDLFGGIAASDDGSLDTIVADNRKSAALWTRAFLCDQVPLTFEAFSGAMLQEFMLRVTDAKDICVALAADGIIADTWSADGKRKPHNHHRIGLVAPTVAA